MCNRKSIPIFSQDWWLDAVCGEENWDVIIIEKGGIIVASMPYALVKQWGFTVAGMPLLTQKLGPWIKYPDNQSYAKRLEYEKKIINKLIENIPHNIARYTQNFDYSVTNKFASTVSKKFDLEGSMLEPVERFFRGFGTVQKPYFTISKTFDKRMRAVYILRDMVNLLRGR